MRALRFHAAKDLRIDDIPPPAAPGEGEVRIRNTKAGICGTDLHEYAHGPIFIPVKPHPYSGTSGPQILGHEFGGVVEAVGNGVDHVRPGDRVSVLPHIMRRDKGYFAERGLFTLAHDIAFVGLSSAWGGMAEKAMLRYDTVHKVPDALTDEDAALVEPTAVVVYACDRGGVHPSPSKIDWFSMVYKDIDIRGSWTYPNHCWPRVMDLIASGILPAGKVVTKRIGLDEAVEKGFEALLDPAGADLKIMIDVAA